MKILLSILALAILTGCNSNSKKEVPAEVVEVIIPDVAPTEEVEPTLVAPHEPVVAEEVVVIEEPVIDEEPVVEPPIVEEPVVEEEPIEEPPVVEEPVDKCDLHVPSIGDVKEFLPFTHVLGMPYYQADYDAIEAQETLYKCDYRSYKGKIYRSLRNWNVYPDEFNTKGNPFYIFTDQAFVGGEYFRQHPVEKTCTQRFTFTAISDINHKEVWANGGYSADVNPTENCKDFLTWATYDIYGQLSTSLYGAIILGSHKFKIDEVIYTGYKRDYQIIPTPNSVEDLDFWELVE